MAILLYVGFMALIFYVLYSVVKMAVRDGINESKLCKRDDDKA